MKYRLVISIWFVCVYLGLTGCRSAQPVSSIERKSDVKKDSTVFTSIKKDSSSSDVQSVERIIEGSTTESVFTRAQFDSLINGLKQMPVVHRTIVSTDPKMQTTLSIILDSLGKIHFRCTSAERVYYEKVTQLNHYVSSLTNKLTKANEENFDLKQETKQLKPGFFEGFGNWKAKLIIWFILVGIGVAIVEYGLTYIKKLKWLGVITKFFKRT